MPTGEYTEIEDTDLVFKELEVWQEKQNSTALHTMLQSE